MIKIASWNVNGLRAVAKKGFVDWWLASGADIVALQEVRASHEQIPGEITDRPGWHHAWFAAAKGGYSGTGITSRVPPQKVYTGIGIPEFDVEGRVLTAEFENLLVTSAYFPNSQDKGARIEYKVRFCKALHAWLEALRTRIKKPLVLTGDFNIAHEEIDLARPKENQETAGFLPQERAWMTDFLGAGWIDTFRQQNPGVRDRYSWWSMRTNARPRNIGWRIDYHTIPKADLGRMGKAGIDDQVQGSDHCPVTLEFDAKI